MLRHDQCIISIWLRKVINSKWPRKIYEKTFILFFIGREYSPHQVRGLSDPQIFTAHFGYDPCNAYTG